MEKYDIRLEKQKKKKNTVPARDHYCRNIVFGYTELPNIITIVRRDRTRFPDYMVRGRNNRVHYYIGIRSTFFFFFYVT